MIADSKPRTAAEMRQYAAKLRRLAEVPTCGGHRADRMLLQFAARLEWDADELDRQGETR